MKKLITTLLFHVALLGHLLAYGELKNVQNCQGDFTLSSQAEVDAFTCTEVTGDLTISGSDIINLDALSALIRVGGILTISDNPNLETIDLPALETNEDSLSISHNANLKSISGFNNMLRASSIYIGYNPKLGSISGFNSLRDVDLNLGGAALIIEQNDALTNLNGFGALGGTPNLRIVNNPKLLALDGFPSLTLVIGDFQISNNESLKTIRGFNRLTEISSHPKFPNAGLLIENNASLEDLEGLSSLKSISMSPVPGTVTLYVTGNPKLTLTQCCSLQPLVDALGPVGAPSPFVRINISGNGGGCTYEDILNCVCDGDVTLTSQAEVDAFSCTEITGSLVISGNDINNLNALSSLRKVGRNVSISDNPNLETIDLPDLHIGDISVRSLSISNNANLKSISGFNNTHLASSIYIGGNPKLGSISGFDSLRQALGDFGDGGFEIVQNNALTNIQAFGALKTTGSFRIVNNAKLLAMDGFPSLTHVIGEFQISNNESLKTINGFNKLMSISGVPRMVLNSALLIQNNASLETLDGLSSLKSISAPLDAGRVPPVPGVVTVSVTDNPKLTACCSLRPLLDALLYGGPSQFKRINISGNGGGCTQEDILNCEKICDGDVTLTSQAEVDAFNCTKVTGNLTVTGADITDLFGLSSLKEVYGHVRIENVNATSLHLSLLDSIGKAFFVMNNPSLARLGLSSTVREGIEISNNENLVQIGSSHELKKLGWLAIQNNPKLTSVFGFDSVETMEALYADPFGPAGIAIVNNDALTTMPDFQILKRVGSITITGNDQLTSLEGFPDVTQIEGVLTISDNSSLRAINGFENLESIVGISKHIPTGGLLIENNPLLEGFQGLSSLKEIRSDQWAEISINNNASLKNVDGLSSLTTFFALHSDKKLTIRNNAVLENIDSLSSLVNLQQGPGDTYINVTGNPKLTRCCGLKPMLDAISYYDPLSLHIDISQNGGGCTLQDILACTSQRILGYDIVDTSGKFLRHLNEGDVLYLDDLKGKGQTIVANTTGEIGSVKFDLNNAFFMMQNASPYTLTGDNYGTLFKPWIPQAGAYAITATPYSEANAGGVAGQSLTIHITVKPGTAVVSYDIVNTSGTVLRHLNEGDILFLDDLKANGQTIVANTTGEIGSVKFDLNNKFFMMQNASPYTLTGDNYGTYFQPWVPQAGTYTLTATPYSKSDAVGCGGQPLTIHFMVKPQSSTAVVSYDIVNTSGKIVRRLNEVDILYLHDLKGAGQTIVANTTGQIGSVKFDVNNAFFMMQNAFPYTLTGDNYGTYFKPWIPRAGAYAITARPYSKSDAGGVAGRSLTIHVTVVDKNKESVSSRIAGVGEEDSLQGDGISDVTIYPVPVDNELHVKIDDSADPEALVTIRNIHGLVIYHGSYSKSQEINTSQLRAGVYFLQITGEDGFLKSVKFMKE